MVNVAPFVALPVRNGKMGYAILESQLLFGPMNLQNLVSDFPSIVRQRGERIYRDGLVRVTEGNAWSMSAQVQGSQLYSVELSRGEKEISGSCDCPYFESTGPCKHIWAVLREAAGKDYLVGEGRTAPLSFVEEYDADPDSWQLSSPPAPVRNTVRPPSPPSWKEALAQVSQREYQKSVEQWRSDREIFYTINAANSSNTDGIALEIAYREPKQNGEWGKLKANRIPRTVISQIPNELDREILTILGGVPEPFTYLGDSMGYHFRLKFELPFLLLPRMCATGRCRLQTSPNGPATDLALDEGEQWQFRLNIERVKTDWLIRGQFHRGEETMGLGEPVLLLNNGILIARGLISRFDDGGAEGWMRLLRKQSHIVVPGDQGNDLVAEILKLPNPPKVDWPQDLQFEQVKLIPQIHLLIEEPEKRYGRRDEKLEASLSFDYGGIEVPFEQESGGVYEEQARRYLVRDRDVEGAAAAKMRELGFREITSYSRNDAGWELNPKKLPVAVRELVKAGWHLEAEGKVFRRPNAFRAELSSGIDWFELDGGVDYGAGEVKLPELLKAMQKGEHMVRLGDGTFGIIPEELLERYGMLAGFGNPRGDVIQFSRAQAGLLDVLLADRPEIGVDAVFTRAREEFRRFDGIAEADQPAGFSGELRGYQKEGLGWMHFLQRFGFGGCLADDMGVGKTPQVLALLETRRNLKQATGPDETIGPSLVVVPRSLIYNWMQEAARFCPGLRVLDHSGAGRENDLKRFENFDVILTTYGTLRRDVIDFQDFRFDYVILDEAQAVKNSSSESAKAVRLLKANHRLAMSGTPVENHLGELWSLFEFLNPGMLGSAKVFQSAGGALRNPDEASRRLLARAVRPFILRRTKDQVARELPEKLEQTLYCELDPVQRKLYNELRDHFRSSLLQSVEQVGMAKSKMKILEALLRLRQAACHPGLIDKKRVGESSAKLDMLLPQISEVMEEGHKLLVFSQFTSMLSIVRDRLDKEGVVYEYLDGKTRDRQARVERFQGDPECKLFLVSLKAGGVGLNLTAAEYVYLLDPWWNPAVESQAIDRAHRIGQTRRVFAYRLIARETVEEKVLELQAKKRDLADAIINEDNRLVGSMRREDLELLFS